MPALAPTIAAPPVAGKGGPTRTEIYAGEVLPPNSDALRSLPAGVDPQRFRHSLQIAVMQNPRLLDVDPRLTFREVAKAASLGLFLDPQLGEAYLVISRNSRTGRDEPQLRVGYRGLLRLARQAGDLSLVYAQPVHANDPFKVSYGDSPRLYPRAGPVLERPRCDQSASTPLLSTATATLSSRRCRAGRSTYPGHERRLQGLQGRADQGNAVGAAL